MKKHRVSQGRYYGFTQFDPFEDTERQRGHVTLPHLPCGFTQFDPFEDTESGFHQPRIEQGFSGFTQFDPFEDTERPCQRESCTPSSEFHPIRSVRGY